MTRPANISAWENAPSEFLYSVAQLDATPLATLARRTRYYLIARGEIPAVAVGASRFVTKRAILDFIRRHEDRTLHE